MFEYFALTKFYEIKLCNMGWSVCETLITAFVLAWTPKSNDEFRYHCNFISAMWLHNFSIFKLPQKYELLEVRSLWHQISYGFNLVYYVFLFETFLCHLPIQVEEKSYELPCQVDSNSYEMFSHHTGIVNFGWIIFTNVASWKVEKSERLIMMELNV